jgi:hypothetical protein
VNKKIDFLGGYFPPPAPSIKSVERAVKKDGAVRAYYSTEELAAVLNMSVAWVEKWRHSIAGASQIGRIWRFEKRIIDACIAKGKDVRFYSDLTLPLRETHIADVHGAVRSGKKKGNTYGT